MEAQDVICISSIKSRRTARSAAAECQLLSCLMTFVLMTYLLSVLTDSNTPASQRVKVKKNQLDRATFVLRNMHSVTDVDAPGTNTQQRGIASNVAEERERLFFGCFAHRSPLWAKRF